MGARLSQSAHRHAGYRRCPARTRLHCALLPHLSRQRNRHGMILADAVLACKLCFFGPDNMAFDSKGALYVTDTDGEHHARIMRLAADGTALWTWDGFSYVKGARNGPEGIAIDSTGMVYVTD